MGIENIRKYGNPPYTVALLHGGPGALGGMLPLAQVLASDFGILEPLQRAESVAGQVEELKKTIEKDGNPPVTLVGYSWGAWLGFIFAAKHPKLVKKVILVSSGSFEERYAENIMETRLKRLNEDERQKLKQLMKELKEKKSTNESFKKFGKLIHKADSFDPIDDEEDEELEILFDVFEKVWKEAADLRKSGKLLKLGTKIKCPVVAIQGSYDPHMAEGISEPLSKVLQDFKFIRIPHCGHTPWKEKFAKDKFYRILINEIS